MPIQAEIVSNGNEVRKVFESLNVEVDGDPDKIFWQDTHLEKTVDFDGETFKVNVKARMLESEMHIVGFPLTCRYHGKILDADHPGGRPEVLAVDPKDILDQVHGWWPEAIILLVDVNF